MVSVTIENTGEILNAEKDTTLLSVLLSHGYKIKSPCGGKGLCKKCQVKVFVSKEESSEKVLSCQYRVSKDIHVRLRDKDIFVDKKSSLHSNKAYQIDHSLLVHTLDIDATIMNKGASLIDLVEISLGQKIGVTRDTIVYLNETIKDSFKGYAVLENDKILGLYREKPELLGVAMDIGTTTMVLYLVDLQKGEILESISASNPQEIHGADVISRITYALESAEHQRELKEMLEDEINRMVERVASAHGIPTNMIFKASVCGNTTMMHLLLGLDVSRIGVAPYLATYRHIKPVPIRETRLCWNKQSYLHVLPNISGYVGADTVSLIAASGLDRSKKNILAVDLGTNGEIALVADKKIYACSTAAGPAFEGASIRFGMRADEGAIEAVEIVGHDIIVQTIQQMPPIGICGSGLIDAVAKLRTAGLITARGNILDQDKAGGLASYVGVFEGQKAILLSQGYGPTPTDVWLTQKDVRELQLAKGAMLAGMQILLEKAGIKANDLTSIYLAGAFGNYVDNKSAQTIRLFPDVPVEKIHSVGNAAGTGVIAGLLSEKERKRAKKISEKTIYVELSTEKGFNQFFAASMKF